MIFFIIFGLLLLAGSQITDIALFIVHLFSKDVDKLLPFVKPKISKRGIDAIYKVTSKLIKKGKSKIPIQIFARRLRVFMRID